MRHQFRYFEDYHRGQSGITSTRTITEADGVNYAGLSADYGINLMDRHLMAKSMFKERIFHGHGGTSLVTGLLSLWGPQVMGRGVPESFFHRFNSNYRSAIRLGDTIRAQWEISDKTDAPQHEGFGLVTTGFQVLNQDDVVVYDGNVTILVRKQSSENAELLFKSGERWKIKEYAADPNQVYYIEDYPVEAGGETNRRTVTEADVINYAAFSGDYNPQFVDVEFTRKSAIGERIAPGMLVFSIAYGLWVHDYYLYPKPSFEEGGFVGHVNDQAIFHSPVKIGDTVGCRYKTISTRHSKSKPGMGLVTFGLQLVNQRNEVVMEASTINIEASRKHYK